MSDREMVVAVVGPTAVGKSAIAVGLAERLGGEIICADSRQMYRRLDAGTDKVPPDAQRGVPHHLQDSVEPDQAVSAGRFARMADEALAGIRQRGCLPLLVGGSGLYIEAFLSGIFEGPERDEDLRRRLREIGERKGGPALHRILARVDSLSAIRLQPNDTQRIVRALEVRFLTGRPLSTHLREQKRKASSRHTHLRVGLTMSRETLYQRIEARVDRMFSAGLVGEVRDLLAGGLNPACPALNAIGYAEVVQALSSALPGSMEEARERIKQNTRRLAKRQMTWFRHHGRITWFERESDRETVKKIEDHLLPLLQ